MIDERELDARLEAEFGSLREHDARSAPAFGPMLARARATVAAPAPAGITLLASAPGWSRARRAAVAGPLLLAAALAAIWIIPDLMKEREFERAVSEWSRRDQAIAFPTDGLLQVPGVEFLGRGPSFGGPATRRGS